MCVYVCVYRHLALHLVARAAARTAHYLNGTADKITANHFTTADKQLVRHGAAAGGEKIWTLITRQHSSLGKKIWTLRAHSFLSLSEGIIYICLYINIIYILYICINMYT